MSISENIQKARENKGLSQEEAAQKAEIPLSTYRAYEQGRQSPPAERLKKIALALGVSADKLIFGTENNELDEQMRMVFELFDNLPPEIKKHAWIALRGLLMTYETEVLEMIKNGGESETYGIPKRRAGASSAQN